MGRATCVVVLASVYVRKKVGEEKSFVLPKKMRAAKC